MLAVLKVTTVIIGTIIGAGFISGQEIYSFFNQYGNTRKNRTNNRCGINFTNNIQNMQNNTKI